MKKACRHRYGSLGVEQIQRVGCEDRGKLQAGTVGIKLLRTGALVSLVLTLVVLVVLVVNWMGRWAGLEKFLTRRH